MRGGFEVLGSWRLSQYRNGGPTLRVRRPGSQAISLGKSAGVTGCKAGSNEHVVVDDAVAGFRAGDRNLKRASQNPSDGQASGS